MALADKVTAHRGSEELYRRAASTDKTLKLFPEFYHDLSHEPDRQLVIKEIVDWIVRHLPALS